MQEFKSSSDIGDFTRDTLSKFLATKTFNTNRSITHNCSLESFPASTYSTKWWFPSVMSSSLLSTPVLLKVRADIIVLQ